VRLFVALNLSAAERHAIYAAAEPVREGTSGATWVAEENLHITLKFLGREPAVGVAPLCARLREVAAAHAPVRLALGGVDAFPNLRAPRIVWMGATAGPAIERLHHDVEEACGALGYEREGRPYRPHITLGRVKARLDAGAARRLAERARGVRYSGSVEVRSVDLMSSTLTPAGSRYAAVAAAPLGGA
jgi:2'-5' RNA ligase